MGVNVVLAFAGNRLSRKQAHITIMVEECERHGVRLNFMAESFEQSSVGEFILFAKCVAAELEREKIA